MSAWPDLLCDPESARTIAGEDESIAAIRAEIGGHPVVLVWCRFEVAAGTLSVAGGRRFVEALEAARAEGRAVVAIANSGGARMQEGTRAFVQMVGCTAAVEDLRAEGLAFIVYLAHPTTGGVFASWASLGQLTMAEPGATIGFTGPRVAAALGETITPASSQTAEGLLANGLVDGLVARPALREALIEALAVFAAPVLNDDLASPSGVPSQAVVPPVTPVGGPTAGPAGWAAVQSSRRPERPCTLDALLGRASARVELGGDRTGGVDAAVSATLALIGGRRVMVIGHRRGRDGAGRPTAAGLRVASRAMAVAEELGSPVVTVIETSGARIGGDQEAEGLAGEIARSMSRMLRLSVPTVALLAGQGSGGAALAWLVADRVLAAPDGWLAPIAPEAGSLIVHRDADHAADLADRQRVSAEELLEDGVVDSIHRLEDLVEATLGTLDELRSAGGPGASIERRRRFSGRAGGPVVL